MKRNLFFIIIASLAISSCSSKAEEYKEFLPEAKNDTIMTFLPDDSGEKIRISYIDVGQGDSEFIELPNGETLLIDAGTNDTGGKVVDYIESLGYTSIDYLVGTHPHEDHIGGLDDVINSLDIEKLYMPKTIANTKTFEDVLDAADAKGLSINTAKAGVTITESDNFSVKMVAPVSESYSDTNNYSAVIRIIYGDTAFLFTGDAEELSEKEITDDVRADVLKAGHHGSNTSTGDEFLDRVSPTTVIISCGKDNKYGHPSSETIDKLEARGIDYYRTDVLGTIIVTSDGSKYSIENAGEIDSNKINTVKQEKYVLNTNTKKIHKSDCESSGKISDENRIYTYDYKQALSDGYMPCGICKP